MRSTARIHRTIGITALAGLLLAGCSNAGSGSGTATEPGDPHASEVADLVGVQYRQSSAAPFLAAAQNGVGERFGIGLEPAWAESSPAVITQLVGGDGHVGTASLWGVVNAVQQGIDLRVIGENFRDREGTITLETLPDSGIAELADLEGARVGVVGLNSGHDLRLKSLMQDEGLDWESVEFVDLPFGEMGASLETGVIDAGTFAGAVLAGAKDNLGTVTVTDLSTGRFEEFPSLQWIATGEFVDANPNAVAAFQCAVVLEGAELVADGGEAFEEALRSGLEWDEEAIEATVAPLYPAASDPAVMQIIPDIMADFGVIDESLDIAEIIVPLPASCE